MPGLQLKIKKSEDEIRRVFFDCNLKKAASVRGFGVVNPNASHEWTDVSELRLFTKVIYFKPAGVNRHFNLGQLINYMNNIYEDEEDTDFEAFLTPEDFRLYQKRREMTNKSDIYIFKPAYKIRPSGDMIMEKMRQLFDMDTVENHEYLPDVFTAKSPFEEAYKVKFPEEKPGVGKDLEEEEKDEPMEKEESPDPPTPVVSRKKIKEQSHSRSRSPNVATSARKKKTLAEKPISRSASPLANPKKH